MQSTFQEAVDEVHAALAHFVNGDAEPVRLLFSDREDVVLCNPLVPFAVGPVELAEVTRAAAAHFTTGTYQFESVATFNTDDLGYIVELERFAGQVDGREGSGALRVTMISGARMEAGGSVIAMPMRLPLSDRWSRSSRHRRKATSDAATVPTPFPTNRRTACPASRRRHAASSVAH